MLADSWRYVDTSQILPPKSSPLMTDDATDTANLPVKSSEPYFIVPPGFRPNIFFVGLEKEYNDLDKRLFGKRRHEETTCVLLYGQPGGGKSHLARQYVNKNRTKFPGGIFWVPARSGPERDHAFSNIKQKVISTDSPESCDGANCDNFVQIVKAWFEGRHEWLIVFDGITAEEDQDATDLANFIPNSNNSSIIYISRARNLEMSDRLLRPSPIKVGPLKEDDAKKLLFKELHIKKPSEAENRKATELVRKVNGLPLAIIAISRRLADTHEPLPKYKLSTSADPTIEETYNTILDDMRRRGHEEAWTLINILCWFAQDLPFEMVNLGLRFLKADGIEVRARDGTGKPDIDNTIATVMKYALIERNEPDDRDSVSSNRDSLNEPEPIDMLKLHSVVQDFCCESQNRQGLLPQYLGHAVTLFLHSYREAHRRIKQKSERGRISDYRYYETHGKWLWNQTKRYESKTQSLESIKSKLSSELHKISEEIRRREPGSSQESLQNGIFQISIFDRTSSSSDSGPIGPPTPNYRPAPPPLANENNFGFPIDKAIDSPASFGTASPGLRPKILSTSPRLPSYEDDGYESDRSGGHRKTPMQRDFSEHTARPPSPPRRSRAPTTESHGGEWHVVRNSRKQPRGRRDLGSFRPTPAKAQVNRQIVTGSIPRSTGRKENRRGSSPAFRALERVQSRSPPSSAKAGSFFLRNPSNPSPTAIPTRPTWAGIAAGRVERPPQQMPYSPEPGPSGHSGPSMVRDNDNSASFRPGSSGGVGPSPLASEFIPRGSGYLESQANTTHSSWPNDYQPAGLQYTTPYPGSNSSLTQLRQGQQPLAETLQSYYSPRPLGPNPAPLPYEDNLTLTS